MATTAQILNINDTANTIRKQANNCNLLVADVRTLDGTKAANSTVVAALAGKAANSTVVAALAGKAANTYVNATFTTKAYAAANSYVNLTFATKGYASANTFVNAQLALKASITYVDSQITTVAGTKAANSYVNIQLGGKAANSYVVAQISAVNASITTKANTATTITASTGLTGGGSLAANRTIAVDKATTSDVRSATSNKVITSDLIETASALVALTDAATVAVDWDAGINRSLTVTANRIIGNPTNGQPGTSRTILVQGNDTTDRTITFAANYLGEVPTITDCDSGRWYLLHIFCVTTSHFVVSSKRAKG